ncbi:hypothetical protein LIER_06459 [Lithospermum erythrorhizon]|uniref:Alpha 1,4-glycosyltransferase domain-containing protein n=1 Tax=Lithospermum erythrorhizon TaxID=34254 RepID=A0AAV3P4N2_LITER
MFRNRRRPRYGAPVLAAVLLLLCVSLLYPQLSPTPTPNPTPTPTTNVASDDPINNNPKGGTPSSTYYFDHSSGVVRRGYYRRSIEEWEDYVSFDAKLRSGLGKLAFGSDDIPVDERIRKGMMEARKIEDALLLKGSPLRVGWGDWFDKKTDFLRRDKMFKSNLESFNPLNNPILQDPDSPGVTGLTRGDKIIVDRIMRIGDRVGNRKTRISSAERRTLGETSNFNNKNEVHADGKRWGYYPGLDEKLGFSEFMDVFFSRGNCSVRVFMVWNSPSWAYGVRHQRGLESVLFHHKDACVLVFSETIELNFFNDFVEEGFKVAVVMPNLDELLKDTPTHIFASVWYEWKQTKYYPAHYSELIRLAVLYKYGGIYLDSDIIVLKPLSSLLNTVGMEDEQDGTTLNGAVMASDKHSHFIMECLKEFYASYDDTNLRWNGADLLNRVAGNLSSSWNHANKVSELMLLPSSVSFPINRKEIPR